MPNNPDGREHYQIVPDSVLYDSKLRDSAVRVYTYLSGQYRDRKPWKVVKGIYTISNALGMSQNTVSVALRALQVRGHIHITKRRGGKKGEVNSSEYYFRSSRFAGPFARESGTEHAPPAKSLLDRNLKLFRHPKPQSAENGREHARKIKENALLCTSDESTVEGYAGD